MRGLRETKFMERRVDAALQAAFDVPIGLAMSHVVNGRHTYPTSLPGLTRQSIFAKSLFVLMDARVNRAFMPVFDGLMPAHDGVR